MRFLALHLNTPYQRLAKALQDASVLSAEPAVDVLEQSLSRDQHRLHFPWRSARHRRLRFDCALACARLQLQAGHERRARHWIDHALALASISDVQQAAAWRLCGECHYRSARIDQALDAAARAARLDAGVDNQVAVLLLQADCAVRQRAWTLAEEEYRRALSLQPHHLEALYRLARFLRRRKRYDEAIDPLETALRQLPDQNVQRVRFLEQLATVLAHAEQLDRAEACYHEALDTVTADSLQQAVIEHNFALLLQRRAAHSQDTATQQAFLYQAVALVQRSLETKLQHNSLVGAETACFQLGVLHWKLGDGERACACLEQAVTLARQLGIPRLHESCGLLAHIARHRGDDAAAKHWQRACEDAIIALAGRHLSPEASAVIRAHRTTAR